MIEHDCGHIQVDIFTHIFLPAQIHRFRFCFLDALALDSVAESTLPEESWCCE